MDKMLGEETELLGRLPAWRYEKSMAVKVPEERMRSIAAGLLLVKALADASGVPEDEVREAEWGTEADINIEKKAANRERISSVSLRENKYYFNLSHSGEYAAVVVGTKPGIGIDIETKVDKGFKITNRMFTKEERDFILGAEEANKRFRNIWTKKESFLKCTGEGISVPLNSFTFDMESGQVIPAQGAESVYDMQDKTYYTETFTEENYSLSVTTQTDERFTLDIEHIKVLV